VGGVLVDFKIVGGSIVVPILGWDSDMFRVSDLSISGKMPGGEKEIVIGYLLAKNTGNRPATVSHSRVKITKSQGCLEVRAFITIPE